MQSRGIVLLSVALAMGIGGRALAADDIDDALSAAGKVWYDKYCTPCHGAGGAPGTAVHGDSKKPVDLRTYVARRGGKFPAADWLALIADASPGNLHTKVWETIKKDQPAVTFNEATSRGVVGSIARYVNSVQTK
jgi:hypothetical protein